MCLLVICCAGVIFCDGCCVKRATPRTIVATMSDAGTTITSITPTQGTTFTTPALVATPHTTQQTVIEAKFDAPPSYDVATRFSQLQQVCYC